MEKTAMEAFGMPAEKVGELLGSLNSKDLRRVCTTAVDGVKGNALQVEKENKRSGAMLHRIWGYLKLVGMEQELG